MRKPKLYIHIEGGMIQYLEADRDIEVLVRDTDNEKVGETPLNYPTVVVNKKAVEKKFKKEHYTWILEL